MAVSSTRSQYKVYAQNRFRFAPVTKFWCGCTLLGSCALIPFKNLRWHFVMTHPTLAQASQLWKIFTSKLFFLEFQGIISGCILMYYLRTIERRFGSRKFVNFLFISFLTSVALEIAAFEIIKQYHLLDGPFYASGPYSLLFSCLVQFFLDFPMIPYGYLHGIPISGKMLPYLISVQMLFISPRTTLSCLCGLLAGLIYRLIPSLNKLNFIPEIVCRVAEKLFSPLTEMGEDRKGRILPVGATVEAQRQEIMDRMEERLIFEQMRAQHSREGAAAGVPFIQRLFGNNPMELPAVQVSETNIQTLMDMGFQDRNRVVQALQGSNDNVSNAANFLLHNTT